MPHDWILLLPEYLYTITHKKKVAAGKFIACCFAIFLVLLYCTSQNSIELINSNSCSMFQAYSKVNCSFQQGFSGNRTTGANAMWRLIGKGKAYEFPTQPARARYTAMGSLGIASTKFQKHREWEKKKQSNGMSTKLIKKTFSSIMFPSINWWGFPSGPTCALPSHGLHRLLSHSICAAVERKLHQRTGFQVSEGPSEIWDANHCCLSRSQCFSKILVENVGWTLKMCKHGVSVSRLDFPMGHLFPWFRDPQWRRPHWHLHCTSARLSADPESSVQSCYVRDPGLLILFSGYHYHLKESKAYNRRFEASFDNDRLQSMTLEWNKLQLMFHPLVPWPLCRLAIASLCWPAAEASHLGTRAKDWITA